MFSLEKPELITLAQFEETVRNNRIPSATGLAYNTAGLTGEAGEFANQYKRLVAQTCSPQIQPVWDPGIHATLKDYLSSPHPTEVTFDKMILELGDVLWYTTSAAHAIGTTLPEVAIRNILKLEERYGNIRIPRTFYTEAGKSR